MDLPSRRALHMPPIGYERDNKGTKAISDSRGKAYGWRIRESDYFEDLFFRWLREEHHLAPDDVVPLYVAVQRIWTFWRRQSYDGRLQLVRTELDNFGATGFYESLNHNNFELREIDFGHLHAVRGYYH